ncbi:hypothetical protein [Vibrio harveyi]|uniref:hypothetical protein n=1 Tax=Vibrio harveyi TaxID=669 RepID=UPI0018F12D6C|nr:hypothetical protein [Vibrio harveyi]
METRALEIIRCAKVMELNIKDPNVQSCIIATLMCPGIHENNLGMILSSAYSNSSQSQVFILAIQQTHEYQRLRIKLQELMSTT